MIPYLGPFIACIPVGAVALTQGFLSFALSIGVLIAVQQIDGLVLSPRIVGSSTGFAPAAVMISIFASGAVWGALGMLLALPCMILILTCGRVFVELRQNY
jgi:predicted PurR-regulated permease PerM